MDWSSGYTLLFSEYMKLRGCIQKFPNWPPGARFVNRAAL